MRRAKGMRKRRKAPKSRRSGRLPEIVAAPLTRSGYDYLTAVWPALLEGGIGSLEIKPDALLLLRALNRLATGGTLEDVQVSGGAPAALNALLIRSVDDANYINEQLGAIQVRS